MRTWLRLFVVFVLVLGTQLAQADPQEPTRDKPLTDPAMETQARAFMREIRCVVCQSQSIDESDAEIAAQLRNAIREQMAAGKSPDEIRDFLVARYGDFVLFKPPFRASTLLLWIGPFVLVAVGLGIILLQRRRKSALVQGTTGLAPPDLSESERARVRGLLQSEDEPPAPSKEGA